MGKYKRLKRELAVLLSVCMVLGMTPISVRAEEKVSENIVQTGETASEKDVQIETETVSEKDAQTETETVPEKAVQIEAETVSEKAEQTETETVSEKAVQTETETASENIVQTAVGNALDTAVQTALGESSDVYELTLENGAYYDSQRVKYTLSTDGSNTATVSGYDKTYVASQYTDAQVEDGNGWEITIPAKVSYDGVEYGVTEVGRYAFKDCKQLTKIEFSMDSVVEIVGFNAFQSCSFKNITLPDSLKQISETVFRDNVKLEQLYIPKNVRTIGRGVCYGCTALESIRLSPENRYFYTKSDVSNCIIQDGNLIQACSTSILPKGERLNIKFYAFAYIDATKVDFSDVYITKIEDFAFFNAKLPENWVLPSSDSICIIYQFAFYKCNTLKKVVIPDSDYLYCLSSLYSDTDKNGYGYSIFSKCENLKEIVIPNTFSFYNDDARQELGKHGILEGCNASDFSVYIENSDYDSVLLQNLKKYAKIDYTDGGNDTVTNEDGNYYLKEAYCVQFADNYIGYTLAKAKDCATLVPIPGDSATFTITADEGYKAKPVVKVGEPGLTSEQVAALSPVSYDETKGGYTITVDKDSYVVYLENYGKCGHNGKSTYTLQNDESGKSILTKVCDECGNVETGIVKATWRHGIRQADSIVFSCDNINMKGTFEVTEDVVDSKDTYSYKFIPIDGSCTETGSVTVATLTEESSSKTTNGITYSTVKSESNINTPLGNCSADIYYDNEQSILHINGSETYVVSGTTKKDRIVVNNTKPTTLVLNGLDIQMTSLPSIDLKGTADVKIVLAENTENTLKSTGNYAALQKNDLSLNTPKLAIYGSGSLTAYADYGAAIGAEKNRYASKISFINANVMAESGGGSGIGNGYGASFDLTNALVTDYIIDGGNISASSESSYGISGGITVNNGAAVNDFVLQEEIDVENMKTITCLSDGFVSRYDGRRNAYAELKGNVTIDFTCFIDDLEIPEGSSLTVAASGGIRLNDGKSMINNGALIIKGYITYLDLVINNGTIYNYSRSDKTLADKVTGFGTLHEDTDHDGLCDICEAHEDIGNVTISDYTKAVTITQGGTFTLSAAVTPKESGNGREVTYEWYQLGTDGRYTKIKDVTTAEYTQDSSSLEPGKYTYRLQALCDGIIRYIPFTVTVKEKINIQYNTHSITLGDYIGVNFYVTIPEAARTEAAYMEFSVSGRGGENTKIKLSDITAEKDGRYKFTCQVNAIEMAETVTAVFHYGENETAWNTYSVREYIETIMADGSQPDYVKNMVRALADYGYYAQRCLAETNGWELDKDYAQMLYYTADIDTTADLSAYAYSCEGEVQGITGVKRSLSLDSKTAINLYFTIDDSLTEAPEVVVKNAEGNAVDYELTLVNNGSRYRLTIPEIYAHKLGEVYTITVNDTMTIRTSALSYAYAVLQSEQMTAAAKKAVAAMYQYYKAAIAYQNIADYSYSVK